MYKVGLDSFETLINRRWKSLANPRDNATCRAQYRRFKPPCFRFIKLLSDAASRMKLWNIGWECRETCVTREPKAGYRDERTSRKKIKWNWTREFCNGHYSPRHVCGLYMKQQVIQNYMHALKFLEAQTCICCSFSHEFCIDGDRTHEC
jgi:hypothetical protein